MLHPLSGTSYYRLRQVEYDGTYVYSEVIAVNLVNQEATQLYPNPTTGSFPITNPQSLVVGQVILLNSRGQRLNERARVAQETPSRYRVDLQTLPPDCYFLLVGEKPYRVCKVD
ncbi:MAG: hypothetical protein WA952_21120 [Lewinella sp.]